MSFGSPLGLLSLLVVPAAAAGYALAQRRRARYAVAFTNLDVLASVVGRRTRWRSLVPPALALLALTSLCVAVARPRVTVQSTRQEGTVILVVDVSRSMVANDVRPSRLGAARNAIRVFLGRLPPRFAIGMISFSNFPQVVMPVTTDRAVARRSVDYLLPEFGTAIGDALARAVEVGRAAERAQRSRRAAKPPPLSILLLSDGSQRNGTLLPEQGAQRARDAGYPIYTIALGTPNGVVRFGYGGFEQTRRVPPDPATLRRIAQLTGGEFFAAPSAGALKAAYRDLGKRVSKRPRRVEATAVFVAAGAGLLLAAGLLSQLWSPRIP